MSEFSRENYRTYKVRVADVVIGGGAPVVVQSMTNTPTADVAATVQQVIELAQAGSELVRLTVNDADAARAIPYIREGVYKQLGRHVPLVGCFHYNGHQLLQQHPECAQNLDKYRINPGNVGFGNKRDRQFESMIECALRYERPIRIGVNWGSLDQQVLARLLDDNAKLQNPLPLQQVTIQALVASCLESAAFAEKIGLSADKIILSAKVSRVQELVTVYQMLAQRCDYPLHLGLTEAGPGTRGIIASAAALAILLQQGIGDTIRFSLTPAPGAPRSQEVTACCQLLQAMGLRSFAPQVTACPGCGRTTSTFFQDMAFQIDKFIEEKMPKWAQRYPGVQDLNIAVMGCIVNGPGESKHADIGISLPGSGESPVAPVFIDGVKTHTLRGDNIVEEFQKILESYIHNRFNKSDL